MEWWALRGDAQVCSASLQLWREEEEEEEEEGGEGCEL